MLLLQALASGSGGAAAQASTWQQNAAAWVHRLGQQFGAYRDILQPVQVGAVVASRSFSSLLMVVRP